MRPIDTPEFWAQVKLDFKNSTHYALCGGCKIFKDQWDVDETAKAIRNWAVQFLQDNPTCEAKIGDVDDVYLFDTLGTTRAFDSAIRFAFLDYMIAKTSRNEVP